MTQIATDSKQHKKEKENNTNFHLAISEGYQHHYCNGLIENILVKTTFPGKTYSACFKLSKKYKNQKKNKENKIKTGMLYTTYLIHEANPKDIHPAYTTWTIAQTPFLNSTF